MKAAMRQRPRRRPAPVRGLRELSNPRLDKTTPEAPAPRHCNPRHCSKTCSSTTPPASATRRRQRRTTAPAAHTVPRSTLLHAGTCAECGQEHEGEDASATECVACGEPKPVEEAAEDPDDRYRGYKCGLVTSVEDIADKLKACSIDIGGGNDVTIVTNAANVEEGSRVVVATVGAVVGEEALKKRSVGGRTSEGMLCDAPMLGWVGGGAGAAALVPEAFGPGSRPPERRPRMDGK